MPRPAHLFFASLFVFFSTVLGPSLSAADILHGHKSDRGERDLQPRGGTPEPGTLLLLGGSAVGYLAMRRRKDDGGSSADE